MDAVFLRQVRLHRFDWLMMVSGGEEDGFMWLPGARGRHEGLFTRGVVAAPLCEESTPLVTGVYIYKIFYKFII